MGERDISKKVYPRTLYNGPDDEIVISGISGSYPNALNICELEHKLYNKIDMVDEDERRWPHDNPEIPKRSGKINNLEKFDATFFGVHSKQAHKMDPKSRILIEKAYEAILDAGMNPKSMRGTKTGVFIGVSYNETENEIIYGDNGDGFSLTGCTRTMLANRISYTFDLQGPSHVIDTACSSSLYALDAAFTALRNKECDAALVGGTNLTLYPNVTMHFARLGVLAADGFGRPFDADASGYVRAETISVILLQKSRNAKRVYSTLVHSKTNCDGFKEEGISHPSEKMQIKLINDFYKEINIKPETISYIEAHATGTIAGDPVECIALDAVYCKNRNVPMPVGSIRSNLGHSEAASGMCSIAKCILAMENQLIPPNLHFYKNRLDIEPLQKNRLQVVNNTQKIEGPLIAINSTGLGGANAHCLLKANPKVKLNYGAPEDSIPRLVNWSGRTEDACNVIHEALASQPIDAEYIGLLHNAQSQSISGNVFKSYGLYKHVAGNIAQCITKEVQHFSGIKRPIVYVFSGMGSQWNEMGTDLLKLPIFRQSIQKCHDLLKPKGLDLMNIITSPDKTMFDNILHSFVGIASIQAALCDCLTALNIQPDFTIGHSVGELGCAYADNCLTMEEMVLCAYSRGIASLEVEKIQGSMAAIGLSYTNLIKRVPSTIDIACHNGPDSCTISGPCDEVTNFITKLKAEGVFAKEVACSNIAYHSRYISNMGPILLKYLLEIIRVPKKRSTKWLSTSIPESKWNQPEAQYCSAQYQTNNLLGSVLFEEASLLLPHHAVLVEIAPHGLLQSILRKSLPEAIYVPLVQRDNKNNLDFFLTALGKIYLTGIDIAIEQIYPKVKFPVSRGTPKISHLIKWDHSEDWFVLSAAEKVKSGQRKFTVSLQDHDYEYILGHVIDGRCLFPATGYLSLVWQTFASMNGTLCSNTDVQFDDVKYLRATSLTDQTAVDLLVMIQPGTGRFEISEGHEAVVTGYIKKLTNNMKLTILPPPTKSDSPYLPTKDFYKELRLRGYHYNGLFRAVVGAQSDGLYGKVRWDSNWVSFMDCLLQVSIVGNDTRNLLIPTGIEKISIDTKLHQEFVNMFDPAKFDTHNFEIFVNKNMNICQAGGIEVKGLQAKPIGRRIVQSTPVLESYEFIPYLSTPRMSAINAAKICVQHALENVSTLRVKCVEVLDGNGTPLTIKLKEAIEDLPLMVADLTILTSDEMELENIQIENGTLSSQSNCLLIIKSGCLNELKFLETSQTSLLDHGYIISREAVNVAHSHIIVPQGFSLVAVIPLDNETLVMLQKKSNKVPKTPILIKVSLEDTQFRWLEQLKAMNKEEAVILYSQDEPLSGIIGLVNCIRKEPNGANVKCVFIDDPTAPPFDTNNSFYKKQLELNFAMNIFRNATWGTYRHLAFETLIRKAPTDIHAYVNQTQRGDLSSLRWFMDGITKPFADNQIQIQYAALNFKDIMLATGKLVVESSGEDRLNVECQLGFEYSGVDSKGTRIMGMVTSRAISTYTNADPDLMWCCPKYWSLEDCATVPVVYSTVYIALFLRAKVKKGKSILIHAGTGGIGLAAIRVSLAYGLNVFTTVSTNEKREYLLKTYPELKDSHIGNSRDLSFERMVKTETNGAGVDYVLNSLAEEKLHTSLRCLGKRGQFLEIGKFDLANDTKIGLREFLKNLSFHAILVDQLFSGCREDKLEIKMLVQKDIDAGIIKPLPTTVFSANQPEAAFRYLASGKHIGKVLLKIRDDPIDTMSLPIEIYPRANFQSNASYIIVGGLGGFGLELIDWLIIRGARKIVISSSRGISKPYQAYRIKIWETYGVTVKINVLNVATQSGCEALLNEAIKLGPVAGIFNLAVVLQDAILENQNIEKFKRCFTPKVNATIHLDQLSRKLCQSLTNFVVFSSVSCGRGNAGQSNYGMANSIMERIIEQRHLKNLPGKAIQWGAVGEVGLVADLQEDNLDMEIGGTLQQRISSCLNVLDALLLGDRPIVASMVVAEKRGTSNTTLTTDMISYILNIMSIKDIKSIPMDRTLPELGMDSLMAVEIKQTLEHDFDIILSAEDLRTINFSKLVELNEKRKQTSTDIKVKYSKEAASGIQLLFQNFGKEIAYEKSVIRLPSRNNSKSFKTALIIIPGVEGIPTTQWNTIASSIDLPTFCVQLTKIPHAQTINEIIEAIFTDVHEEIAKHIDTFYIVGYSFGSLIAIQLANKFEEFSLKGNVILIDGSLPYLKKMLCGQLTSITENDIEVAFCVMVIGHIFPEENEAGLHEKIAKIPNWQGRLKILMKFFGSQNIFSEHYLKCLTEGSYNRLKIIQFSKKSDIPKIKSSITLIRPTEISVQDIAVDYELEECTEDRVHLKYIEGNHTTMVENPKLIQLLNELQPNYESDNN